MGQAIQFAAAGEVFHYPIGDRCGFAVAVEGCQIGGQPALCLLCRSIRSAKLDQAINFALCLRRKPLCIAVSELALLGAGCGA